MKPMFFKSQQDLLNFLQNAPRPHGEARVQGEELGARQILQRCIDLVPQIFEYRKTLAKGANGLGNYKSVDRYAEIASDSVSAAKLEAYGQAVEDINREVEMLLETGGGSELAETLKNARTQVAAFTMVRESIEGFRDKLNKYMIRVEETYADLSSQLKAKEKQLKGIMDSEESVRLLMSTMESQHRSVTQLVEAMNEYCALQVAYNGLLIGNR